MFSFGIVEEITGNMRNSALVLAVFFIAGLILLFSLLGEERKVQKNTEFSAV
jgi:UMF1 family MFS transporter